LLIGVISFFRDTAVWEKLKESVLPDLTIKIFILRNVDIGRPFTDLQYSEIEGNAGKKLQETWELP